MVTENLHTKFQPIRTTELSVIAIYAQIASGHILLAVRSCASVAIFSKVEMAMSFFFAYSMTDAHLVLISSILEQAKVFET